MKEKVDPTWVALPCPVGSCYRELRHCWSGDVSGPVVCRGAGYLTGCSRAVLLAWQRGRLKEQPRPPLSPPQHPRCPSYKCMLCWRKQELLLGQRRRPGWASFLKRGNHHLPASSQEVVKGIFCHHVLLFFTLWRMLGEVR